VQSALQYTFAEERLMMHNALRSAGGAIAKEPAEDQRQPGTNAGGQ
jgi:hypothetical protein